MTTEPSAPGWARRWAGGGLTIILDMLLAGAGRGEIRAEAATPILATGPALLLQHLLMYGTPAPPAVIEEIVDRVILPAASPR
jgi:hypothetical protein